VILADATPQWPADWTAVGTVALAAVTVAAIITTIVITVQDRKRADKQLAGERAAADKRLADEIRAADERLRQERQGYQDQEQWAEAYLVQVTRARRSYYPPTNQPPPDEPVDHAVAIVVNHGRYTITRVEARLYASGNVTSYKTTEHLSSWFNLPEPLRPQGIWEAEGAPSNNLTPMDLGLRYTSDVLAKRLLTGNYPIVRWTDRWGQQWEHKQGVVRKMTEGEEWHA